MIKRAMQVLVAALVLGGAGAALAEPGLLGGGLPKAGTNSIYLGR